MRVGRAKYLLYRCAKYIDETGGGLIDPYDVLTNVIGFTETELDTLVYGDTDPEAYVGMVSCEDVTGILGQMFAYDTSGLPEAAVRHLQDAYQICAEYLK